MKRLLAWITIACMLLNIVGSHCVAVAAGESIARDVVVRSEEPVTGDETGDIVPETATQDRGTKAADGSELTLTEQTITADCPQGKAYEEDQIVLSGLLPEGAIAEAVPAEVEVEGQEVLVAYDISVYAGEGQKAADIKWQPEDTKLQVEISSPAIEDTDNDVEVWHKDNDDADPELVATKPAEGSSVAYDTDNLTVSAVVRVVLEQTLTTSDGSTYNVQVTYSDKAGIPMDGTELLVSELRKGDAGYDEYIATSAGKLGIAVSDIAISRVFDIKIVDAKDHSVIYEPKDEVSVSITLAGVDLNGCGNVDVLHFTDDRKSADCTVVDTDNAVDGDTVSFTTDSFSVYVVLGHEEGTVVNPRVEFHFISGNAAEQNDGSTVYYIGDPYTFKNKNNEDQTTQILRNGEPLELIIDPDSSPDSFFYGWYVVDPFVISETTDDYGIGKSDSKLYYTWPGSPEAISFETPITIDASNVEIDSTVEWSMGSITGTGKVDKNGNVHVFLVAVSEKYNFVDFLLYPRDDAFQGAHNVMARKFVVTGNTGVLRVKVSDVRSNSTDAEHLIFTGWEYNAGTEDAPNWVQIPTVDYSGAEIMDAGEDGVYLTVNLEDKAGIDLYPIFIRARWVDFISGVTGSGASFVGSRFLESWGPATPPETPLTADRNCFENITTSERKGYNFGGWYAFAVTDPDTGDILNLTDPMDVTISYIDSDSVKHSITINTTAVQITDGNGDVVYDGTFSVTDGGNTFELLSGADGKLKLYDGLDRLKLYARWISDSSKITIVYWTENADDDDFKSSAALTIDTADLNAQLNTNFGSGSEIYLRDIEPYTIDSVGVLSTDILDDVKAVPANEDIFYERDTSRPDDPVVISGDGSTVFNVYYKRRVFKLVFHIGRDGYVKTSGSQKTTEGWNPYGNWIQFMFKDDPLTLLLGFPGTGTSQRGVYSMTYNGVTYDSTYVATQQNILGDYVPDPENDPNDANVYVIEAKYGAYIGDRWPSPVNSAFTFTTPANSPVTMYTWAGYYDSLYCRIANERPTWGGQQGNNPDLNGIYNYMSAELCSNRAGTAIINENQVHHIVAYFGRTTNQDRFKHYHILYEAMEGTYDPETVVTVPGSAYAAYSPTTWSTDIAHVNSSVISDRVFFEAADSPTDVISNVDPQFQMAWELEGYDYFYSCYNVPETYDNHVYFFYTPKQYSLTFMYEDADDRKTDQYYYSQSLADAKKYDDPEKEGYRFLGWYTNEAGAGEPFDFANEKMPAGSIVLYPVFEKLNYVIKIDPNGAEIDRWRENSDSSGASTGFRADYHETVSSYNFLERNYTPTDDAEIAALGLDPATDVFYYMNAQYRGEEYDGMFIPSRLRNAIYLTESEIDEYWQFYDSYTVAQFEERGAVKITDRDEWMDVYFGGHDLSTLQKHRRIVSPEKYTFMGWYRVYEDGTVSTVPFDFNTLVTENIEIRAIWRLEGGYYIQYNPYFDADDGEGGVVPINASLLQWTDPDDLTAQYYSDQAQTSILHAPTDVTSGWVFRGWRVVRKTGTQTIGGEEHDVWEPIQFDGDGEVIYYQPGDIFKIDSAYVTEETDNGAVIHMQAYYEKEDTTYRRPSVTNLILDANDEYGGYVNTDDSTALPAIIGPGSTAINTDDELYQGHPTQILFGDIQSNVALHLYQYATTQEHYDVTGTKFFVNEDGHLLIGFDEEADPTSSSTGDAYIPAFAADSVIAVTRNELDKILYAMWEPMVYVTFVNTTDQDITIELTGSNSQQTVSIVNMVTGEFDREKTTTVITVPAKSGDTDGMVKIVLPGATPGTDTFTATVVNDHSRRKMSVEGEFDGETPYGDGSENIPYNGNVTYTGTLQTDPTGVIVTYTEVPEDMVIFDVNEGEWTETSEDYIDLNDGLYTIHGEKIVNNQYRPADPVRDGKIFLGWTINADIAAHTDFSSTSAVTWGETTITPDADGNVLDKVRSDYLWDFSEEPPYDQTLYAVWSDTVTVTFDLLKTGSTLHNWTGPETSDVDEPYVFYRNGESRYVTYTVAKGEASAKPEDPTSPVATWYFVSWLLGNNSCINTTKQPSDDVIYNNAYKFTQRVTADIHLYTSWTANASQEFTFIVENQVINGNADDEFTYTIAVVDEQVWGKNVSGGKNAVVEPNERWGSVTTTLKNNEQYTVHVKVSLMTSSWVAYSIEIDVTDSTDTLIKSGHMIYCVGNSKKNFASSYKYNLVISQEAKNGYETTVTTDDPIGIIEIDEGVDPIDDDALSYTFTSRYGTDNAVFTPALNGYEADGNNGLTIIFTNTGSRVVAPTGYSANGAPYLLMILISLLLYTAMLVYRRIKYDDAHPTQD